MCEYMIMYLDEWQKYMIVGKVRTFVSDTPKEILEKAMNLNEKCSENTGNEYFYFERKED